MKRRRLHTRRLKLLPKRPKQRRNPRRHLILSRHHNRRRRRAATPFADRTANPIPDKSDAAAAKTSGTAITKEDIRGSHHQRG